MTAPIPRCLLVQPIDAAGVGLLRAGGIGVDLAPGTDLADLAPLLATADAVITRNHGLSAAAMALAPRLRVIASHGTGTDRIDIAAARARGIAVINTPGSNAQAVAEQALALLFAAARRLPEAEQALRRGDFDWRLTPAARGIELAGRRLGLWGYGHVARHLARMARGIGMEVQVLSSHARPEDLAAEGLAAARDAGTLLAGCDAISLHALPGPRPLLAAAELAAMRPGAILVNTARGRLVDEAALASALTTGRLGAAALDVFAEEPLPPGSPLLGCPNLILTPHVGGTTVEALRRTAEAAARAVLAALKAPQ
ncbi:MAG: hydroxyacid dehydrogenase [Rhodobacteraceae bacterium]|jgi:D-3-phosphoglycerate dehydrogenase|nr:hydroxyacid dehydrogenase [Paracoccaceae bacterium]